MPSNLLLAFALVFAPWKGLSLACNIDGSDAARREPNCIMSGGIAYCTDKNVYLTYCGFSALHDAENGRR